MAKPLRRRITSPSEKAPVRTAATVRTKPKTTPSTGKDTKPKSAFDRGSAGFAKARQKRERQEEEYQKRKDTPFSFWLKPGTEAEVIILDKGAPFFVSMHKVKIANGKNGKWVDEVCIADTGQACPLCESTGKEGSYTMVLTCLDRRPYKVKSGVNAGKTIKVSKKLLYVKGRNLPKFERQYNGKAKENLRGIKILCHRSGEKESAMGEDLEFRGRISEELLAKYGENAKVADYAKIFAIPSASELAKRYGTAKKGKVAGGEEFDDDDGSYDEESVGWGEDEE